MRNHRKIARYIERIIQINDSRSGDLNVEDATRLLAILSCLKLELTAYLKKMKL